MNKLIAAVCLIFLAIPAVQAADVIVVVERVDVLDENHAEARFYYENNWLKLREKALARGFIHSYELGYLEPENPADADILLVTRFASRADFDLAEERFQELIAERGSLKLLNELTPSEFRKRLSSEVGEALLVTTSD